MNLDLSNQNYWPLRSRANKTFKTSGSDNSGLNIYTYNELGYRGDSVVEDIKIITVGCSHTEGIGVNNNETWPAYLSSALNVKHINMGFTGRSNDYIARTVNEYVTRFNPNLVIVMYTYPSRREYWTEYGPQPYAANAWGYFEDYPDKHKALTKLSSEQSDYNNWYLNHQFIKNTCKANNTSLIWDGTFLNYKYSDNNYFSGDYNIAKGKHANASQNKLYSSKLEKYIKSKNYVTI